MKDRQGKPLSSPRIEDPKPPVMFGPDAAPVDRPVRHRPLIDLFPPDRLAGGARPPGPLLGTAAGPNLPPPETFYGPREAPFDRSSDPKFLFHSRAHARAAAALRAAIRRREGMCLLTGASGIGKTTVCRAIVDELDRRVVSSLVLEPLSNSDALVETLLVDFGLMSRDELARAPQTAGTDRLATLSSFLESLARLKATALVVLDDAHRQPADVLELVHALASQGASAFVLQAVLVAPQSFAPSLRALDASVKTRLTLDPLAADEIADYIMHRLSISGTHSPAPFDQNALQRIHELSRGTPGIVNLLCDRALTAGFERSASTIDVEAIDGAAFALGFAPQLTVRQRIARVVVVVLALAAGAATAAWVFHEPLVRTLQYRHLLADNPPVQPPV